MALAKSNLEVEFPFSAWEDNLLRHIEAIIWQAWNDVVSQHAQQIKNETEEQITEWLECRLQKIMDSGKDNLFNRGKFQSISRGSEVCSFDRKSIKKKPDLIIRFIDIRPGIDDSRYDALFIECKLLDQNGKTPLKYIKDGIRRFVDGEYSWAMPHATMLGYLRDNAVSFKSLEACFKRNPKDNIVSRCSPTHKYQQARTGGMPHTYHSEHERSWKHPDHGSPGSIKLDHVWLKIN